jgi:hypothetical protein
VKQGGGGEGGHRGGRSGQVRRGREGGGAAARALRIAHAGRVADFYASVAAIFEAWVGRRKSQHTQRASRGDVMAFVEFMGWKWPEDFMNVLRGSILDVQAFKTHMVKQGAAPKTINRRISSLSARPRLPPISPSAQNGNGAPAAAAFLRRDDDGFHEPPFSLMLPFFANGRIR